MTCKGSEKYNLMLKESMIASDLDCLYINILLYPPQNEVLGGYTVFSLSVIPSFRHSVILSFRQHFEIFAE